MPIDARGLALSYEEQCENLTALNDAFAERDGSLAFPGHVLGAIVAHGDVLSGRNSAAERRLQVVQPVALLKGPLGPAAASVGDPGLGDVVMVMRYELGFVSLSSESDVVVV